jgi:hypothetical protein
MRRSYPRVVALAAGTIAVVVTAGLLALPSHAARADACAPDVAAKLATVSRQIVPVGLPAVRGFTVEALVSDLSVSAVSFTATGGVKSARVSALTGYALRLTAPRAGAFEVHATWTQQSAKSGEPACTATGVVPLRAAAGTPIAIKPPPVRRFPGVKTDQYDAPVVWTWRCTAESDPAPLVVSLRWEVDPRSLPAFSKGGHEPFRFTKHAKTFAVTAADACDPRQGANAIHPLPHGARLRLRLGGSAQAGGGSASLLLRGGFRTASGSAAAFHLGVTMRQGRRTLLDVKLCSWQQTGFVVAKGSGVSCWW